ncbi:MAG: hypothetical protein ACK46X_05245, partial [Candidatus Sericytochromatia bacterium]
MFHKTMAAVAAAVLLSTTAGCYQTQQQAKSADQIAAEKAQAERDRQLDTNRERFARAAAGSTMLQQHVANQDWEAATDTLNMMQQEVERMLGARGVSNEVKGQVGGLIPAIHNARTAVQNKTDKAAATADALAKSFNRTAETLLAMGFLEGQGGGAGTTPPDADINTTPGTDEHHDNGH